VAVLGELVVTDGRAELPLQGPIPRRLVALLAHRAGEFISADALADAVWAGTPPPAARATLQSHVARLRRAIGAQHIESGRAGYRLSITPADVDAHCFVALAESGRQHLSSGEAPAAKAALDKALALWRGPAYAEFSGSSVLESEAARLHHLRVDARHWQLEAGLSEPGVPPVAAIEAMVREHPTREGLWILLMKALYRAGRQADALHAYRSARRFLIEELGVEPSRELRETEQLVLTHDPSLDPSEASISPPLDSDAGELPRPSAPEVRERKVVTIAAIELPIAAAVDPEDVAPRGRAFRDLVRECVAAHDGMVYAELEGLVVATFGVRRARTDDAARALRTAIAVVERSGAQPQPRAAVVTGDAVVVTSDGSSELGGPLLAAVDQLRSGAEAGEVLIDEATRPLLEEVAAVEPAGTAWRVVSVAAGANRRRSSTPFVGREQDLALLRGALDKALSERRPQLVTVEGEPGLGKTRLLQEFESRLLAEGIAVSFWRAQCPPSADAPLRPVADIVRAAAGVPETAALGEAIDAVRALLPAGERTLLPRLLAVIGVDSSASPSRGDSLDAWRRFVELTATRPTVIVVEDLHWAADLVLEFVESLASIAEPCPITIVTTTRPELREWCPAWGAGSSTLHLSRLNIDQTIALIDNLTSDAGIDDSTRDALIARSGGVPLFAEELARLVRHEPSQLAATAVPPALSTVIAARIDTLGPSLRDVLSTAAVVGPEFWSDQVAAVLGVDEQTAGELLEELARRAFVDRIRPTERPGHHEFVLTHELIREAAEQRLTREDRARRHWSAFRWWVGNVTDARDAHAAVLAHHACSAYDLALAAGLAELAHEARAEAGLAALAAGQRLQGIDTPAARRFLTRAVELVDPTTLDHARAQMWFGAALADSREFARAEEYVTEALDRLERANDPMRVDAALFLLTCRFTQGRDLAPVYAAIGRARAELPPSRAAVRNLGTLSALRLMEQTTESLQMAIEVSTEAIELARAHGTGGDGIARVVRGRARLSLGDADGLEELENALEEVVLTESGTHAFGTRQWHAGAMHHWRGPAAERASRDALEALAAKRGLRAIASMSLAEDVRVAYELGDLRGAIAMVEDVPVEGEAQPRWAIVQRGLALLDLGELDSEAVAQVLATPPADDGDLRHVLGVALVDAGAAVAAGDMSRAVAAVESIGGLQQYVDRDGAVELLPRLVRTALACDRADLVASLSGIDAVPTPLRRSLAAMVSGLLAEARGDIKAAAAQLSEAVEAARALGFRVEEALTLVDLARNLGAAGDPAARRVAAEAEAACTTLGIRSVLTSR
jgi:DNA-binding SARP family transcriptional activator/tetratricopeptide (TPR) repeat protein